MLASLNDRDADLLQQLQADLSCTGDGDLVGENPTHQTRAAMAEAKAKKRQRCSRNGVSIA